MRGLSEYCWSILEELLDSIRDIMNVVKTSGSLRQRIFNAAHNAKKQAIFNGKNPSPIWDKLVFNKIKARLGGRVRYMISAASPISPDIMDFLRVKKNIFKLAQGEYVAPEKIENVYAKSKYVAQCFIHGDSLTSSLVAIVCMDPDMLKAWAINEGIKNEDVKQLCTDPRVKAAILKDMNTVGKEAQLRGFEFAKAITLVLEPFTMENDLLTPTYKIKRPQARAYFAKELADMYAELSTSNFSPNKIF